MPFEAEQGCGRRFEVAEGGIPGVCGESHSGSSGMLGWGEQVDVPLVQFLRRDVAFQLLGGTSVHQCWPGVPGVLERVVIQLCWTEVH